MGLLLIGVVGLKLGDLILKRLGVTCGLLQRFKLGVTLFDRVLCVGQFGVDLVEAAFGYERTVQALHDLIGLFLGQAPFQQFFLCHSDNLQILFYRGLGTTIFPVLFTAHHRETAKMV